MNPANTEIGKLLAGREANFHFDQLHGILANELAQVRATLRRPSGQEQFLATKEKESAISCALMVLKSVQLYQGKK